MIWKRHFSVLAVLASCLAYGNLVLVKKFLTATTRLLNQEEEQAILLPRCRVAIENRFRFHLEVFESAALMFPLPWITWREERTCDVSKPVLVDFAQIKYSGRYIMEAPSFVRYFEEYLQNKTFRRSEHLVYPGALTTNEAGTAKEDERWIQYGSFVDYQHYRTNYHAVIGLSCDFTKSQWLQEWLNQSETHLCVVHQWHDRIPAGYSNRVCRLHPHWKSVGQCFFVPSAMPLFGQRSLKQQQQQEGSSQINLCVSGSHRQHDQLAEVLYKIEPVLQHQIHKKVSVHILMRAGCFQREQVWNAYQKYNVTQWIKPVIDSDFVSFEKHMGQQCHAMLPLISPQTSPQYFHGSKRKLSGSVSKVIGYKQPAVMLHALEELYGGLWTAPVYSHNDTTDDLARALLQLLHDHDDAQRKQTEPVSAGGGALDKTKDRK